VFAKRIQGGESTPPDGFTLSCDGRLVAFPQLSFRDQEGNLPIKAIGHAGICVSDIERSVRFWRDGLGFEILSGRVFYGSSWRRILEVGELELHNRLMRRDHMTLELLEFRKPGHLGTGERGKMTQLGFTHLAVWVSDIEAAAQQVVAHGGTVIEETRTEFNHPRLKGKWLICCDPDGVRVELVEYPEGESILEP
jgi:lactoylglutathione lyase